MLRDLRVLTFSAVLSLLAGVVFFPAGCASSGSPSFTAGAGDASTGTGDGAKGAGAGGGGIDGSGSSGGGGCQSNVDCAASTTGHVCVAGACQVCGVNADCPTGQ